MKDISAFLDMGRYYNWAHKISTCKYLSEELSCQFFPVEKLEYLIALHPELLSGVVEGHQLQQYMT